MPQESQCSYGFGEYVCGKAFVLICYFIGLLIMAFMLSVLQVEAQAIAIVAILSAVPLVIAFVIEYLRGRNFYRALASAAEEPETAKYLSNGIDRPRSPERAIVWDALATQESAFSKEISDQEQEMQAYRDYVELWIHEVKTPIAAARLILASEHGEQAERISSEVDRIERQVESALYYARSTSLSHDYSIKEVSLADAVRSVCKKHARHLIGRGTAPDIEIPDEVRVLADRQWIEFVIAQIVINAANYKASKIRFTVEEKTGEDGSATILQIADNGCGIPAADMPHIFDRGFTGSNGKSSGSSTGMGLYLVSMMCQKMGLGLMAASEVGSGTRILISFPHDRQRISFQS